MSEMEVEIARLESESLPKKNPRGMAPPEKLLGTLPPPVAGKIIARFGDQDPRYNLKKFQRGIVLRVDKNAPVSAVAGGKAVHAGAFRGYQSLVVLDHGNGLFTVYGHLEDLGVKRGEWVDSGKRLGQATYQPLDQAYDVYFEIRHNGKPDDPLRWIKPVPLPGEPQPSENGNALGG
jgi:septal ring factor EnvC (AmiA/AmiB activator)